jgi:hypothetical protein
MRAWHYDISRDVESQLACERTPIQPLPNGRGSDTPVAALFRASFEHRERKGAEQAEAVRAKSNLSSGYS